MEIERDRIRPRGIVILRDDHHVPVDKSVPIRPCELQPARGDIGRMLGAKAKPLVHLIEGVVHGLGGEGSRPDRTYADDANTDGA